MSDFVQHLEMEDGLSITTWNDDAPVIGFQVNAFNWRLRRAREAKGWSRVELARQIGISPGAVGDAERLRRASASTRERIALALGVPEDVLFPGEVDALPKDGPPQIELSLTREDVASLAEPDAYLSMIEGAEQQALTVEIVGALDTIDPRARRVIERRFGLLDGEPRSLAEVGEIEGVTRERVRQIEAKAMRKLRHPSRSRPLRTYLQARPYGRFRIPKTNPPSDGCRQRDARGACFDRFSPPGWMQAAPADEIRRPMFVCEVCWAAFLDARAQAAS